MTTALRAPALEGSLGELALPDVLQLLELGRKTGVLQLHRPPADRGVIALIDGRVIAAAQDAGARAAACETLITHAARAGRDATELAAHDLLSWTSGTFAFATLTDGADAACRRAASDPGRAIGVDALLIESARRADEWARVAPRVPGVDAILTFAVSEPAPGTPPLALAPDDWALLAEVDGARDVRAVARALGRDPLAVAVAADALAAAGLLAVQPPDRGGVPAAGSRSSSW